MSAAPPYPPPPPRPPGSGRRRPFPVAVVAAAVVVLVIVGGAAYWLGGRDDGGSTAAPSTPPAATASVASTAASATAGPAATVAPSATVAASGSGSGAAAGSAASQDGLQAPTSAAPSPTVTSPTVASPTVTPAAVTTSPPVNPVPDFGYLHTVVTTNGVTKLTFDRAILLTGPAAASYAKAKHTELDDDYIIQNDNPLIRTWTVSPTVVVTGSIQLTGKVASTPSTIAALQAFIPAHTKNFLPVDLYYDKNDTVTKIAEVFFP